jgi:hypothetical protein
VAAVIGKKVGRAGAKCRDVAPKAPTSALSPLIETDSPKLSLAAPSLAVSFWVWLQVPPELVKT